MKFKYPTRKLAFFKALIYGERGRSALLELEWILMEMGAIKGPQRSAVRLRYRSDQKALQKKVVPKHGMPEAENFIKTRQKFLAAIRKPFSDYLLTIQ